MYMTNKSRRTRQRTNNLRNKLILGCTPSGDKGWCTNAQLERYSSYGHFQLELSLNVIIPPPAHCHRAGFGNRMENGLVRVALNKIVSKDRWTDRQTEIKIAYAQLHIHTNIMCKFQSSTCKNVGVMLWITMI